MGAIILIIFALIMAVSGDHTLFWIFGGAGMLSLICMLSGRNNGKASVRHEGARTRIRIPGYEHIPDYYVCSVCGSGFRTNTMTCPRCGMRFNHTKTDEQGLIVKEIREGKR